MTRLILLTLFAIGCASGSQYPRRECLYDSARLDTFLTGTTLGVRSDGARIFRYDDPTWGDNGIYIFTPVDDDGLVDVKGKRLRPCVAALPVTRRDPWGGR